MLQTTAVGVDGSSSMPEGGGGGGTEASTATDETATVGEEAGGHDGDGLRLLLPGRSRRGFPWWPLPDAATSLIGRDSLLLPRRRIHSGSGDGVWRR